MEDMANREPKLDVAGKLHHHWHVEAFRDGKLLLDRGRSRRIEFEVRRRNEYFDLLPILEEYRRGAAQTP